MKDMPTREYPHLENATAFPGLGDPYAQYSQTFDYTQWKPGVVFRLFNVAWNERNIVDFGSEEGRDAWMSANASSTTTFKSLLHLQPDGTVKLPLPFEALSRYNYLTVTFPKEPVNPNSDTRVDTWCYYIRQVNQSAPSTTTLLLELDPWQTFGYMVRFSSMQLERGHAPMSAVTVDEYLENPVANNGMLLAPDVSYGDPAAIVTHSEFHPFGAGSKIIMFATTMDTGMLKVLEENAATAWTGGSTKPTYKDNPARWGHQYEVEGYDWHIGAADYSKLTTPVNPFGGDYAPTGIQVYAIEYGKAADLFKQIVAKTPQLMQTIQGMWLVGDDMLEMAESVDFLGFTLHTVQPVHELDKPLNLSKQDFAYDEKYADIAKLYTYPYAALTLSDNDGTSCNVRVENTGNMQIHMRTSMVYPYLKAQAFLTGVNGESGTTYEWRDVNGNVESHTAWNTPFAEFMTKFDIPVYALYMDGATDWALHNQRANVEAERLKALNGYHVGMRNANTGYENGKDSANTGCTNSVNSADTAQANANDSADTAYGNGKRVADSAKTNADRTANTALTNGNTMADTIFNNGNASASTAQTNGNAAAYAGEQNAFGSAATANQNVHDINTTTRTNLDNQLKTESQINQTIKANATANTSQNTGVATTIQGNENTLNTNKVNKSNSIMELQTNQKNEESWVNMGSEVVKNAVAGVQNMVSGVGGAVGQLATGNLIGAVSTGVNVSMQNASNAVNTVCDGVSTWVATSNRSELLAATKTANSELAAQTNALNEINTQQNTEAATATTKNNNSMLDSNYNDNKSLRNTNTDNNIKTSNTNADRAYNTAVGNATRTYNMNVANNGRTYDTTTGNNARTNTTTKANNGRTNQTALQNNELNWEVQLGKPGDSTDGGNLGRARELAKNNAKRTRDVTVANAERSKNTTLNNLLESREATEFGNKTALEQTQDVMMLSYGQHATDAPVQYGANSGEAAPDLFRYRGVQVRVLTQNKGQIALAGDQMLRYGYAYNGAWNMDHLQVMKHFTYWKCTEVWITSASSIMEDARAAIRNMFLNGVTVWSKPDEVGAVDIYDNWKE